jgi:ATP-binding cassette subfamily B protein
MYKFLIHKRAPAAMNYTLNKIQAPGTQKNSATAAIKKLWPLMRGETKVLIPAFIAILLNSGLNLLAPLIGAHVIDTYIETKDFHGVLVFSGILLLMYIAALGTSYAQTRLMGGVGQRVLFNLRNAVFSKLQELPVAFFNQNKAGDLISRINNDTDLSL